MKGTLCENCKECGACTSAKSMSLFLSSGGKKEGSENNGLVKMLARLWNLFKRNRTR